MFDKLKKEYVENITYILTNPTEIDVEYWLLRLEELTKGLRDYVSLCQTLKQKYDL